MKNKLHILRLLFLFLLFCLITRIAYIKLCYGSAYEASAKLQSLGALNETLPPSRGLVLDRNGLPLAENMPVYDVILEPIILAQLSEKEQKKTIETLSLLLSLPEEELWTALATDSNGVLLHHTYYYPIAKSVSFETAALIEEKELKGAWLEKKEKRYYPYKTLASHVIGFLRGNAAWGIENSYDFLLKGQSGRKFRKYQNGRAVNEYYPAKNGCTLITTLDTSIQQIAEKGVSEAMHSFPCETASVIVMNPNTGEVLGMASSASLDCNFPSLPTGAAEEAFEKLTGEEQSDYLSKMWNNFNISSTFEPGSIFKPMLVAAALDENIITPGTQFYCQGFQQVADRKIHCIRRSGHGTESLEDAISNSCNVAMMEIADKMGRDLFYQYQTDFGFGQKTGIDLPNEVSAASLVYPCEALGPVELATSSFGQSFNCTPIQAITAFCVLANGGNLVKPYVVSQAVDSDGNVIFENKPEIVKKVVSAQSCEIVNAYLKAVVERGTGKKAKIEGYSIAGKSGTGEQGNRKQEQYTITFAGFFPAEEPQIAILVVIDKPEEYADGVTTAAPAFRTVAEEIIQYLKLEPDGRGNSVPQNTFILPDFTYMSSESALQTLSDNGISAQIVGHGNAVINQFPKEGVAADSSTKVMLYTNSKDSSNILSNISGPS